MNEDNYLLEQDEDNYRLYYTIAEVSQICNVEKHVIRYWEKEFSQLKPQKNKQGFRNFTKNDFQNIMLNK